MTTPKQKYLSSEKGKAKAREAYYRNREKILERKRAWNAANKDKVREKNEFYRQKYKANGMQRERYLRYRERSGDIHKAKQHIKRVAQVYPDAFVNDGSEEPEMLELWIVEMKNKPCPHCGSEVAHIDHIVPLGKGGKHSWENLRMLCQFCNMAKYDHLEEDFVKWLNTLVAFRKQGSGI